MAELREDDGDGIFKNIDDNYDEVDASSVFTVVEREQVPDKFMLKSGVPSREKSQTYLMLPRNYGTQVGNMVEPGSGVLGLVTLHSEQLKQLTEDQASSVIHQICKNSSDGQEFTVIRRSGRHMLLAFTGANDYLAFGNLFLEGKLSIDSDFTICALEPAMFSYVPRALVSVTSAHGHDLHMSFVHPILPFSAAFTHLRITIDPAAHAPPAQTTIPHLGLVLLFDGRNQALAVRTLDKLESADWKPLSLPEDARRVMGLGVTLYQNVHGGPVLGVKTGCPASGVRIVVFARSADTHNAMSQFYSDALGVDPLQPGDSCSLFPLSPKTELSLYHIPGSNVDTSRELTLIIKANEKTKMEQNNVMGGAVEFSDPDGNPIVVTTAQIGHH